MDRIFQWAWDRHGARYSWVLYAISVPFSLPVYLFPAFLIVAVEKSGDYVDAAAVTVVVLMVLAYVIQRPGLGPVRVVEQWAAGHRVDRTRALEATYALTRGAVARAVPANAMVVALLSVVVGAIAGATGSRLIQYGILGALVGTALALTLHGVG